MDCFDFQRRYEQADKSKKSNRQIPELIYDIIYFVFSRFLCSVCLDNSFFPKICTKFWGASLWQR
jgi:hypothetical protein